MPSVYIQPNDYATYGLAANTTQQQVQQASQMVDSYLKRPEGLLYGVDANGAPAYMLSKTPSAQLSAADGIQPGVAVTVALSGPLGMLQAGDVLLVDAANAGVTEAVQVQAIVGRNVTFTSVQFAHAAGCTLQAGMCITETKKLPANLPMTRVSRTPIAQALSGVGRYGYGRRGDDYNDSMNQFNLLAVMTNFGGPPPFEIFTPQASGMNSDTGELWIPAGVLLAYYTEIRFHYIAGFTYATLPDEIKQAVALTVYAMQQSAPKGNVQIEQAGGSKLQFFKASALSDDVKEMLKPWVARVYA